MKSGIHPKYVNAEVSCVCGNTFITRSTKPVIKLEICSACHPFFTGKQKLLDTTGRVERFQKRFAATGGKMVARAPKKIVKKTAAPRMKVLTTSPIKTAAKAKAKTKAAKVKEEKKA